MTSSDRARPDQGGAPHLLVGVDGSAASGAALTWALEEARVRGCAVHVVSAYPLATGWRDGLGPGSDPEGRLPELTRRRAEDLVSELRTTTGAARAAEVPVAVDAVPGHPAEELARLSADAQLLVVGSRGRSALPSSLLGSVALRCIATAACPVVAVPGMPGATARHRVVVGFDGSRESLAAVEEALGEAVRHGWAEVEVVSTFTLSDHWTEVYAVGDVGREEVARGVRDRVRAAVDDAVLRVAGNGGTRPTVRTTVLEGRPDDVLLGLSRNARLVVVGSRGRGAVLGALLGSVAFACVVRAHCPTMVVPARAVARQQRPEAVGQR